MRRRCLCLDRQAANRARARAQLDPMRKGERATLLCPSAQDPVEVPAVGDALQLMLACVLEGEAGPGLLSIPDAVQEIRRIAASLNPR
jgi:hypothetical protein